MGLLETVLAHAVVHDGFFDFVAGGHDEWTVLVDGLVKRFSGDLMKARQRSTIAIVKVMRERLETYQSQFGAVFQCLQVHTVLVRLRT